MFIEIQGGDYILNVNQISEITVEYENDQAGNRTWESWEVKMVTGATYTIEGDDLKRLEALMMRLSS